LLFVNTLKLVLVFFLVRDVKQLEQNTLELVLLIFHKLQQKRVSYNTDAFSLKDPMYFCLNLLIVEGSRINERKVSVHLEFIIVRVR
jgi:hypothetical protein